MNSKNIQGITQSVMLLSFSLLASSGLVLWQVLPHGRGRMAPLATGARETITLLGLSRHQWGDVHLWAAGAFVLALVIHVALHWRWIKAMCWGSSQQPTSILRRACVLSYSVLILTILIAPFL